MHMGGKENPVWFVGVSSRKLFFLKDPPSSAGPVRSDSAGLKLMVASQIAGNGRMHEL